MDGADQSAHDLPKVVGRIPKGLTPWPQKLQCVVGHGALLSMYNLLSVVQGGANMSVSCFMRFLQVLCAPLEGTIYLQVDGGSENWNQVLFAVVDLLFDVYDGLQKVVVSRLPVGHTHIDIDRFFSYINALLFATSGGGRSSGANVLTKDEFDAIFHKAMSANRDTMLMDHYLQDVHSIYDWWNFLEPHLYKGFHGYGSSGNVHVVRFERRGEGPPHISYKYWHQSQQWLPADGSSLKVLNSRPDLGDLKSLQLEAPAKNHEETLVRLQKPLLKWMQQQLNHGLVETAHISAWKTYFRGLGNQACMSSCECSAMIISLKLLLYVYRQGVYYSNISSTIPHASASGPVALHLRFSFSIFSILSIHIIFILTIIIFIIFILIILNVILIIDILILIINILILFILQR
jgi:hypothetical protein